MSEEHSFFQGLSGLFAGAGVPLLLSLMASAVRFTRYGWKDWRHFFASLTMSIFVGQVVFWGLAYCEDLDPSVAAAIISISAYMGGSLLDALVYRVRHEIVEGSHHCFLHYKSTEYSIMSSETFSLTHAAFLSLLQHFEHR